MSSVSGKKLLIIAVACGVLAATLGWLYLKAKESQYRAAYQPAEQVKVSVIVPKVDIAKSQSLTRENVAAMDVPREYLPSNAVLTDDWPKLENRMTLQPLQSGRPITWDAVERDGVSRFSETVELGKRVKTVKISKINSFDGMLRPGDRIDLMGTFSATDIGMQEQLNYSDEVVITVLENVEVLAAGREDSGGRKYENYYDRSTPDGFNMNFSTLSLMLTPQQVARVELAEKAGELIAALRNPKDTSAEKLGQVTVSSLLDPLPAQTVDVVLDANGVVLGRIVGDKVVDANGRIIGNIVDGQAIGLDGKVMGRIVRGLAEDDPLFRLHERATVVRDADGNVIGKVVDGKVVDALGNVIGTYADGKALGLDGQELGEVQHNVALDSSGRVVDMSRSQLPGADGSSAQLVDGKLLDAQGNVLAQSAEVVRDANGEILGTVVNGQLIDADGKVIGTVKDGVAIGADGKPLGKVEQVLLGSDGKPMSDTELVVRDANGTVLGTVRGDTVYDSDGKVIGTVVDGKVVDPNGKVLASDVRIGVETTSSAAAATARRRDVNRTIQFIPGGTGKAGVLPVQTLRLE